MSYEPNLKAKNTTNLWVFFIYNIVLLISAFFANYFDQIFDNFKSVLTLRASSVLIAPLILYIVNGLLSADVKAILMFWRFKNTLPGCRAFTILGKKDYRVDLNRIAAIRGQLPTSPRDQNMEWYKLYKMNKDDQAVRSSHQKFLLGRDLTTMSFLFIVFSGLPFFIIERTAFSFLYLLLLIFTYLVLMIVARNHGNRFVTNVLAVASTNI